MIWLTWRQHRAEALVVGGALALLLLILFVTGHAMRDTYAQLGIGTCVAQPILSNCNDIVRAFGDQYGWMGSTVGWLNFLPALLAILVGAPLVARELEHHTQRLVWTQSVTRLRWLTVKLGLILGGGLLVSAILTLALTWWRWPFDQLYGNLSPNGFDFEGIVPLAYAVFALALAIAAGALVRKAIPAMVVTLAGFLAVRLPVEILARPHYQPPLTALWDVLQATDVVGARDWVLESGFANAQGQPQDFRLAFNLCAPTTPDGADKLSVFQCFHHHGILNYAVYQPADRFWLFQGIEVAIFGVGAVVLLGLAIWWVRRRLS